MNEIVNLEIIVSSFYKQKKSDFIVSVFVLKVINLKDHCIKLFFMVLIRKIHIVGD